MTNMTNINSMGNMTSMGNIAGNTSMGNLGLPSQVPINPQAPSSSSTLTANPSASIIPMDYSNPNANTSSQNPISMTTFFNNPSGNPSLGTTTSTTSNPQSYS